MIYNGINLKDFGVEFMDESAFITAPERSYSTTSVAGRNGDLRYDNGRWENMTVQANCLIFDDIRRRYGELSAFLTQDSNYHRLEGFKEADWFRLAAVKSIGTPQLRAFARGGLFTVTFDCKPLKYARSGENKIVLTKGATLVSQYFVPAKPLLRVYGYGTMTIGTGAISVSSNSDGYIDVDCDLKDAYKGANNRNSFLTVEEWPTLVHGKNTVTIPATVTKLEITPRWATL